jgi:branched-chain amino acid transport system ATP-binding protein
MILEVEHIICKYGGVVAVDDASFSVAKGAITALIGPNGAGKTTALNIISGMTVATEGRVRFAGSDIIGLRADQICRLGIARTFQTPQSFGSMTVKDNVFVGTTPLGTAGIIGVALRLPRVRREEARFRSEADTCLDLVGIRTLADEQLGTLPFGTLRLAELARALASRPKLLLMDEPASGLSRVETQNLRQVLLRIRETGTTILLVEHNMSLVMSTAEHIYVLNKGQLIARGTPCEIQADVLVQKAYLGTAAHA